MVSSILLLALPVLCAAEPIHIPLRRSGRKLTLNDHFNAADRARARYGYQTSSSLASRHPHRRASSQSIAITNEEADSSFVASLSIGTPPQPFNVVLDTGSSDLFVIDTACTRCGVNAPEFDGSKSSTFSQQSNQQPTLLSFGSGSAEGFIASDTVSMGSFTVQKQTFVTIEAMDQGLISGDISGLVGLAFQSIAVTEAVPFWQALINDNQLTSPEMSFQLTRSSTLDDAPGGTFTLGGTNSSLFTGDIEFHNLVGSGTPQFWMLQVSSATVQGKSVSISTGNAAFAAIDTGTTALGGPSDDVAAIWAAVPGASALNDPSLPQGFFQFPCSTSVSVSLSFGGNSWAISPEDMNLGQIERGSSMCAGAIFDLTLGANTGTGTPSWVVGDTFLKNVYSVFRQSPASVGFAQLSSGGSSSSSGSSSSGGTASLPGDPGLPTSGSSTGASASITHNSASRLTSAPALSTPTTPASTTDSAGSSSPTSGGSTGSGNGAGSVVAPATMLLSMIFAVIVTVL